jgi:uncharacterized protein involved in exopolysaccharide biosynthesis
MSAEPLHIESKEPISIVCYVRSQDAERAPSVADLGKILRSSMWLILATVLLGAVVAGVVALALPPVYRAETMLAIVHHDQQSGELSDLAGNLGGLASLAGIRLPTAGDNVDKTMAIFKSRAFTDKFIQEKDLLPVLYPSLWDPISRTWRVRQGSSRMPTVFKAYKLFNDDIRAIQLDEKAGLVTLDIEWRDPQLAAEWANDLVKRINKYEQEEAISEANKSIAFLQAQLLQTKMAEMRQLIDGLIEEQMRAVMLANVHDDYAFQVVDPAVIPERPARPKVTVIVVLGSIVGLLVGVLVAIYRSRLKASTASAGSPGL